MDDKQQLAELAAEWRSAGNIPKAVTKSVNKAYAMGVRAGMRAAAAICRERSKKLEPERTEHTQEGCYECGAEDEADYLATAILAEADK